MGVHEYIQGEDTITHTVLHLHGKRTVHKYMHAHAFFIASICTTRDSTRALVEEIVFVPY